MKLKKFTGYRQQHYRPISAQRLERWLGAQKVNQLQQSMRGWYGSPINLADVPGSVWIDADGDFVGAFDRGLFYSAADALADWLKYVWQSPKHPQYATLHAGFSSISDALSRASQGFQQQRSVLKSGPTGVLGVSSTLWRVGTQPGAGATPAAAPGGTVNDNTTTGAFTFANPAVGTNRLIGADMAVSTGGNSLLVYDRIFSVTKAMNSTAAEAVTGVPTRYQSTTALSANEDYIGDNFLFVEVGGIALAATAHNWTLCTYLDQANAASTLPDLVGNSAAIIDRLDHPSSQWFAPLATGDNGIKNLTNMQCSAVVATGAINFVIGHPIGFLTMPSANLVYPFDWLTNRKQAPKIMDNACLAFLEVNKPNTTGCVYTGSIYTVSTSS